MKLHLPFLPAVLALASLLIPFSVFADEKADAGSAPTAEEKQAAETLTKRGALVQPLAAGVNWSYVNFRGVEKPDAATFALLAKMTSAVELDLAGTQFQAADLAGVAALKNLRKLNLSRTNANDCWDFSSALETTVNEHLTVRRHCRSVRSRCPNGTCCFTNTSITI